MKFLGQLLLCPFFAFIIFVSLSSLSFSQAVNKLLLATEYYADGEYEEAVELYKELALELEQPDKGAIYERILSCYRELNDLRQAETSFKFLLKKNKDPLLYVFLLYLYHDLYYQPEVSEGVFQDLVKANIDRFQAEIILNWLDHFHLYTYLIEYIKILQKKWNDSNLFLQKLRYAYLKSGEFGAYFKLLLNLNLNDKIVYENIRQEIFQLESWGISRERFKRAFITTLNRNGRNINLRKLWFDFLLAYEEWNLAYREALALDKLSKSDGFYLYQFITHAASYQKGQLIKEASQLFQKKFQDSPYLDFVLLVFIQTLLQESKNSLQDTGLIYQNLHQLIALYPQVHSYNTLYSLVEGIAWIYAFQLQNPDSALFWLDQGLQIPQRSPKMAELEILKGDVLLSMGDLEGAKLLYAKVDREYKGSEIGTMAKFKLTKVAYYEGNFEYALARFKTLKDNPSDLIANDAMRFLLVIQDNLGFDSLPDALLRFAHAQFLYESRQYAKALEQLDSLAILFPNHPIQDEVIWQKCLIFEALRDTIQMLNQCDLLIYHFPGSIWSDDAIMKKAAIVERRNPEEAIELYFRLLRYYPESIYRKEAQERIRRLRSSRSNQL